MKELGMLMTMLVLAACAGAPSLGVTTIPAGKVTSAELTGGLPDGWSIFSEEKLQESVAPKWTQFAVVWELCGERLGIEYIGGDMRLALRARNARTPEQFAQLEQAFKEFDAVLEHHGRAQVDRLDDGCSRL